MALETASYPADLVTTNPTSGDPKSQGDDHIRMIKVCLQNATSAPMFVAYASAVQSVSSATATKVTLGTEVYDTATCFATSRFTPNVEGYYQFNGVLLGSATNMTGLYAAFYKNGSVYSIGTNLGFTAISTSMQVSHSDIIYLNGSTDYVELYGYVGGTSPSFSTTTASQTSRFSGALIRLA